MRRPSVQNVFEVRGCTASTCHGAPAEEAEGGLDLRPENAYANLVNIAASSGELPLVFPADEERSVLYLKVEAKTLGTDLASLGVSGSPMPSSADQLTEDEVALIRAWIRSGAPATGFVQASTEFAGCEVDDDVAPNKIPPLPPPDAEKGIQFYSGGWSLPAESENEVCYVTYHDYTDRVPLSHQLPCPESYGGPERSCFAYGGLLLAQDPQSHHAITESYVPSPENAHEWDPNNEAWKNWQCRPTLSARGPHNPRQRLRDGHGAALHHAGSVRDVHLAGRLTTAHVVHSYASVRTRFPHLVSAQRQLHGGAWVLAAR